jgi:maltooligosyltrehalose trehalohydrolase
VREQVAIGTLPPDTFVAWLTGDVSDYAIGHDARIAGKQERHA